MLMLTDAEVEAIEVTAALGMLAYMDTKTDLKVTAVTVAVELMAAAHKAGRSPEYVSAVGVTVLEFCAEMWEEANVREQAERSARLN